MSDTTGYDDEFEDNDDDTERDDQQQTVAEDQPKRTRNGERFRQQREAQKREIAFLKAQVDTETKFGRYAMSTYEGDVADREGIKTHVADLRKELGVPEPVVVSTDAETTSSEAEAEKVASPEVDESTRNSTAERRALSGEGGTTADTGTGEPRKVAAIREAREVRGRGGSTEDAAHAYLQSIMQGALDGDESVQVSKV